MKENRVYSLRQIVKNIRITHGWSNDIDRVAYEWSAGNRIQPSIGNGTKQRNNQETNRVKLIRRANGIPHLCMMLCFFQHPLFYACKQIVVYCRTYGYPIYMVECILEHLTGIYRFIRFRHQPV